MKLSKEEIKQVKEYFDGGLWIGALCFFFDVKLIIKQIDEKIYLLSTYPGDELAEKILPDLMEAKTHMARRMELEKEITDTERGAEDEPNQN